MSAILVISLIAAAGVLLAGIAVAIPASTVPADGTRWDAIPAAQASLRDQIGRAHV